MFSFCLGLKPGEGNWDYVSSTATTTFNVNAIKYRMHSGKILTLSNVYLATNYSWAQNLNWKWKNSVRKFLYYILMKISVVNFWYHARSRLRPYHIAFKNIFWDKIFFLWTHPCLASPTMHCAFHYWSQRHGDETMKISWQQESSLLQIFRYFLLPLSS